MRRRRPPRGKRPAYALWAILKRHHEGTDSFIVANAMAPFARLDAPSVSAHRQLELDGFITCVSGGRTTGDPLRYKWAAPGRRGKRKKEEVFISIGRQNRLPPYGEHLCGSARQPRGGARPRLVGRYPCGPLPQCPPSTVIRHTSAGICAGPSWETMPSATAIIDGLTLKFSRRAGDG